MQGIWSVLQVRAAEQRVMASLPPGALMARAARAISVHATRMIGFSYGARVLLIVGAGDNGGDALYAGADLARRGAEVKAVLSTPERVHGPALAAFLLAGGRVRRPDNIDSTDLTVDGLLGIGATDALRESLYPFLDLAERLAAPILAVDIPSGVDPDTGAVPGRAVRADVTLCMGALKTGVTVGPGRQHAGDVRVIDIGLGPQLGEPGLVRLQSEDVAAAIRAPRPGDDKYTRGVVGVAAGSARYPGAAQLAVGSAQLGGVGAVRYAGHAASAVVQRWPETLVTGSPSDAGRVQAWVIGPGLGDDEDAGKSLDYVLAADVPVVVDADGLSLLAKRRELLGDRTAPTVLTPHAGEFARFFPDLADTLRTDRVGAARRAAAQSGATVLLKGDATIVMNPDGHGFVNPTGSPSLATAGSGDVLSGLLGSLLATGLDPTLAAAVGAYLHGLAGTRAAADGPVSAGDLIPALRHVLGGCSAWSAPGSASTFGDGLAATVSET